MLNPNDGKYMRITTMKAIICSFHLRRHVQIVLVSVNEMAAIEIGKVM